MDTRQLDQTLRDLTSSLGDATRRGIFLTVRQADESLTVSDIAEIFSIHPNVARHHLDRLADDGYVRVTEKSPRSGPGAGRPAKCYEATFKEIDLHFPARRYDLLSDLLLRVVERVAPENLSEVAQQVGRQYGRDLAHELDLPDDSGFEAAVKMVANAMTGVGFTMEADADAQRLVTNHCPFGATAFDHPDLICSLDQGIVAGLMEVLQQDIRPEIHPHVRLDEDCVTEVPVEITAR